MILIFISYCSLIKWWLYNTKYSKWKSKVFYCIW